MRRVGLVLSGGGARGLAHIGALKALEELKLKPYCITGASMGGIVGALYSFGYPASYLEDLLSYLNFKDVLEKRSPLYIFYNSNQESKAGKIFGMQVSLLFLTIKKGFDSGRKIRKIFKELTKNSTFNDMKIPFKAVAVDLKSGEKVVLDSGYIYEAMYATMAIPPFFEPYEKEGYLLTDGGVISNMPVSVAKSMGAEVTVGIDVNSLFTNRVKTNFSNAFDVLFRVFEIESDFIYLDEMKEVDLLVQVNTDLDIFEFERYKECIQLGYKSIMENSKELMSIWGVSL